MNGHTDSPILDVEQRRLEEAARRYQDFTELSRDWYWEMDDQLRFTYFSKEFEENTGLSLGGILGRTRWEGLAAEDYGDVDWQGHKAQLTARKPFHGFEYPTRKLPGRITWFRVSGKPRFDDSGNFTGYFGIASDVTAFKNIEDRLRATIAEQQSLIAELEQTKSELMQANKSLEQKHHALRLLSEELHEASITDPLTGIYNRRFFLESSAKMLSAANRHRHALSLAMLDVDHFKKINDVYGHLAGDKVLQTLAALWKQELREEDVFARFGGEEFIVAFPNTDAKTAALIAERLQTRLHDHAIELDGTPYYATVSIGVSQYRPNEKSIAGTIKRADEALYAAKNGGRNQVVMG